MIQRFEQFCTSAFSIYRSIQKIERMEMEKFGLKGPHAQCLLTMSRFPEGVTAAQICGFCDKDKAAISRTVSELEAAGMLTVRTAEHDGRLRKYYRITQDGRKRIDDFKEDWKEILTIYRFVTKEEVPDA